MSQNKIAIIYGATGQIGSYLVEYLLSKKEYIQVIGVARRTSTVATERLTLVLDNERFKLVSGDITDWPSIYKLFAKTIVNKDIGYEVYNLAAMSFVKESFNEPVLSGQITGLGHVNILDALLPFHKQGFLIRTYFAGSSEIFGKSINQLGQQDILTPFVPVSPYSCAKLYAYHMNRVYRESYGMFNVAGIVFNTESPRRGVEFVTRKITSFFAEFLNNGMTISYKFKKLKLGNIDASRDWTHAKDTVKAIHLIITNQTPKDYCVASGETHTIKDFLEECYCAAESIFARWRSYPLHELYEIDFEYFRPNEVNYLRGDSSPLRKELGWKPEISFSELVNEMLLSDYSKVKSKLLT